MINIRLKCTLLSDVIINQKAATEGNQETLDFIPGSNFMGIVAAELYDSLSKEDQMVVFHSGKVRFGDAHPGMNGMRTLRIPASMFHPKLESVSESCYIHHHYDRNKDKSDNDTPAQLKQCRIGFYTFKDYIGKKVNIDKTFAIKSAYDKEKRRSKDKQMYGYESLEKGSVFYFDIECDDNSVVDRVKTAIIGKKRIGRSKTAQYGLVEIEECNFEEVLSNKTVENLVTVYADGRLIFIDKDGFPTPQPSVEQLGLDGGKICWEKSQIRTFQYSPWNGKRHSRDTDRYGIEKGSVFVVEKSKSPENSKYIGSYNNEGFGKVIYNPEFLNADLENNGKALCTIIEKGLKKVDDRLTDKSYDLPVEASPLLKYLHRERVKNDDMVNIYKLVNDFVVINGSKFSSRDNFSSQWGTIRSIAMQCKTKKEICNKIFAKGDDSYLTHGIAKDKWSEKGRLSALTKFINGLNENIAKDVVVNLASEMAKKSKK